MAQLTQDSPQKKPSLKSSFTSSSGSSSCFLGCFGFSKSTRKVKEKNKTKFSSCFSWSRKSLKQSVPVCDDDPSSGKLHKKRRESFRMPRFSRKFSANKLPAAVKTQTMVAGTVEQSKIPAVAAGGESGHGRADNNKKGDEDNQKINLDNSKSMMMNHHHSDSIAKEPTATYKKSVVFFRRNSWSQPATSSPSEHRSKTGQKPAVLSHSASMPPASAGGIYLALANGGGGGDRGESSQSKAGKFDQLVGMSIMMVTLIIMIIWGKLCAIMCTSAWLYFYPILRSSKNDHYHHQQNQHVITKTGSKSFDLHHTESKKSKRKVVFEGFLERSHRAKAVEIS